MSVVEGKRITFKRARPNSLFQEWLEELYEESKQKKSRMETMLQEALISLSKYPLPLESGAECAILKGFDKRLCLFLDKRLEAYKTLNLDSDSNSSDVKITSVTQNSEMTTSEKQYQLYCPKNFNLEDQFNFYSKNPNSEVQFHLGSSKNSNSEVQLSLGSSKNSNSVEQPNLQEKKCNSSQESVQSTKTQNRNKNQPKRKGKGKYKPVFKSGSYALLMGLLESKKNNRKSLNKDELIAIAQKYSEESFIRPKPGTYYTGWSNMRNLITKELVEKIGHKNSQYCLTDEGMSLANELLIETQNVPTVNDIIFKDSDYENINAEPDVLTVDVRSKASKIREIDANEITNTEDLIEMLPGSFDIVLLIDKHETGGSSKKNDPTVSQFNKFRDLKHDYRSLKVGDFTWIAQHKTSSQELVLPYIVERKRMDDLGSSIKDGRFHEQKFRLRKCGLNVIYMVENYGSNKHVGLPVQSLMQALANTRVQDGFKVQVTDSLTHSVMFLAMMTLRLTFQFKDKTLRGHHKEAKGDLLPTFEYFNKAAIKNKPLSVTDTFIKILLQLKGVSVEKALAITNMYKTPKSLIEAYKNCERKEGEFLLANLNCGEMSRNVGPSVSKSVYQLFTFKDFT